MRPAALQRLAIDTPTSAEQDSRTDMTMLFVADLHYALKQFDWLVANAANFDSIIIGGDLLDLGSALDFDVQIMVVEKYLGRIRQKSRLLVSSGNHDGDSRNSADERLFARHSVRHRPPVLGEAV